MTASGGAVAVDCVSRTEVSSRVAGVVLENTFTSIPDMAKVLFSSVKLLAKLPQWCHKNKVKYEALFSPVSVCKYVMCATNSLSRFQYTLQHTEPAGIMNFFVGHLAVLPHWSLKNILLRTLILYIRYIFSVSIQHCNICGV